MSEPASATGITRESPALSHDARVLLDAVGAISSDLDLRSVLTRIVSSAAEMTGARYGALGIVGDDQTVSDFIVYGASQEQADLVGALPHNRGILGRLLRAESAVRIPDLDDHPAAAGMPPHHPPMKTFVGVPVRAGGSVFGNLYLTEKRDGAEFTAVDEELLSSLATAAGFVIENAHAFARSEQRRQWLEASTQISHVLQPPLDLAQALSEIAVHVRRVSGAAAVAVVQRRQGRHREVAAHDGWDPFRLRSLVSELGEELTCAEQGTTMQPRPTRARTVVLVPLRTQLADRGVLMVVFEETSLPDAEETELLASFAEHTSLALDRAQALEDRHELVLVADRDRIARDLHDLVIQRLFATGLQLQGARRIAAGDEVRDRLDRAVRDLDVTISEIRTTIFKLQHDGAESLRAELAAIVKEYVPVLGFSPVVRITGPADTAVTPLVAQHVLAVLREGLSNVARHAEAESAVVELEVHDRELVLRISDDGRGLPAGRHESGLRNVRRRADELGGSMTAVAEEPRGTTLEWRAPL